MADAATQQAAAVGAGAALLTMFILSMVGFIWIYFKTTKCGGAKSDEEMAAFFRASARAAGEEEETKDKEAGDIDLVVGGDPPPPAADRGLSVYVTKEDLEPDTEFKTKKIPVVGKEVDGKTMGKIRTGKWFLQTAFNIISVFVVTVITKGEKATTEDQITDIIAVVPVVFELWFLYVNMKNDRYYPGCVYNDIHLMKTGREFKQEFRKQKFGFQLKFQIGLSGYLALLSTGINIAKAASTRNPSSIAIVVIQTLMNIKQVTIYSALYALFYLQGCYYYFRFGIRMMVLYMKCICCCFKKCFPKQEGGWLKRMLTSEFPGRAFRMYKYIYEHA